MKIDKIKSTCKKISHILEWIIGYALLVCLFAGGAGFIGYIVALIIGGESATQICVWLYKTYYVILIWISTCCVLLCFILMYINGNAKWQNPLTYWKNKIANKKQKKEIANNLQKRNLRKH